MFAGEHQPLRPVAARRLWRAVQALAARRSNPVLELLGGGGLREGQRLPDPPLAFGGWRAYYHCHPWPGREGGEHGHFHLFVRAGRAWTHLAALGMDRHGQPREWLALNHWVTAGRWLPAPLLARRLGAALASGAGGGLVGDWLAGMAGLYQDTLEALARERDRRLEQRARGRPLQRVLGDRKCYLLARRPVDLAAGLRAALAESPDPQEV